MSQEESSQEHVGLRCGCVAGNRGLLLVSPSGSLQRLAAAVSIAAAEIAPLAGNGLVALPRMLQNSVSGHVNVHLAPQMGFSTCIELHVTTATLPKVFLPHRAQFQRGRQPPQQTRAHSQLPCQSPPLVQQALRKRFWFYSFCPCTISTTSVLHRQKTKAPVSVVIP